MKVGPVEGMPMVDTVLLEEVVSRHAETSKGRDYKFTTDKDDKTPDVSVMLEEMQNFLESMNVTLKFTTYGENGERIAVVISNKETGEVIREIPPEELQRLYVRLTEMQGIIFNTMV